jgi:O-antigen ligase
VHLTAETEIASTARDAPAGERPVRHARARAAAAVLPALLPGALVALLGLQAGGFFPQSYASVASALAVILAIVVTVVRRPTGGLTAPAAVGLGALALLALWMLLSSQWSHAPGRALVEYVRTLLYVLVLALCALPAPRETKLAWGLRGVAAGMAIVCGAALLSRLAPDVLDDGYAGRLAWPITYWNGLGCLAGAAVVITLHLAASPREPRAVRVIAAALVPALACALYLTLSRAGIAAGAIGVLLYLALGRPRGLPGALLATVPASAIAVVVAYDAGDLVDSFATQAQLEAQGHDVARVLVACMAGAAVVRALTLPLDAWLVRRELRTPRALKAGLAGVMLAAVVAAVAAGAPGYVHRQADTFLHGGAVDTADARDRLTNFSNNNRTEHWRVALDEFKASPLHGAGAGTYENSWNRERRLDFHVLDAHSLYIETLGELGIVGLALLLVALGALAGGIAWRARGARRPEMAAVLAAGAVWAVAASVDWDWELTAVSVWVFGLAGLALAGRGKAGGVPHPTLRILAALGCLFIAVQPALLWQSQVRAVDGVRALERLDCPATIDAALDSISAVNARAEPWQLLAYCDSREGQSELAIRAARAAVARDPLDWEYHYALALVLAAGGQDPRPEAAEALRLNPLDPDAQAAVEQLRGSTPRSWRRGVATLPLDVG